MSTKRGGGPRKPAHQNTFAFQHNAKSKKTLKILSMPNQGLCKKCFDKIEWRKKYRKYKPLRAPAACNKCHNKTVTAAYHTICQPCAQELKCCAWCGEKGSVVPVGGPVTWEGIEEGIQRKAKDEGLNLRETKTLIREARRKHFPAEVAEDEGEEGEDEKDEDEADVGGSSGGGDGKTKMAVDDEVDLAMDDVEAGGQQSDQKGGGSDEDEEEEDDNV